MSLRSHAAVRPTLVLAAASVLALLAGCGWTARDQYLLNQRATVSARPGDGSFLASEWNAGPGRALHSTEVARRFEDPQ